MNIPQVPTPAAAPPPNQPAAVVSQASPYNAALGANSGYNAGRTGVAGLTIPLAKSVSMGGVGPSGLGIPTS